MRRIARHCFRASEPITSCVARPRRQRHNNPRDASQQEEVRRLYRRRRPCWPGGALGNSRTGEWRTSVLCTRCDHNSLMQFLYHKIIAVHAGLDDQHPGEQRQQVHEEEREGGAVGEEDLRSRSQRSVAVWGRANFARCVCVPDLSSHKHCILISRAHRHLMMSLFIWIPGSASSSCDRQPSLTPTILT